MECKSCNRSFSMLGQHLRQSSCLYPKPNRRQLEIIEGLLMSDGSISDDGNDRLRFELGMVNTEFLKWVDKQLGQLSTGIRTASTGQQVTTLRTPTFTKIRERWYKNGEKEFPIVDPTRLRMKMWYVGDGHLQQTEGRPRATIGCSNEYDRQQYLCSLFEPLGINPSFYSQGLWMSADETEKFLDYIGAPVPGFDEKWRNVNV